MDRSLLIIDDDGDVLRLLRRFFMGRGWHVREATAGPEGVQLFQQQRPDLVLLDLQLPGLSGLRVLEVLRQRDPEAAVILFTGHGDIATAVEAIRLGAQDFLTKPVELDDLDASVEYAYENVELRRRSRSAEQAGSVLDLGSSPVMQDIARQAQLLAESDATVLMLGETGTGKGWLAQLIHRLSSRAAQPFVEINCAGLTPTFLDSELFGHERGAFTDAKEQKRGLFEVAHQGTLFLDEVGDLAVEIQPKLLKVLESHRFRRLGGTRELEADVRVIAATNRELEDAVARGRFREDLYYRLAVLPLRLPPLRERGRDDIVDLASRILAEQRRKLGRGPARITPEALRVLGSYRWPGNIRELRNVLERVALLAAGAAELRPEHLPTEVLRSSIALCDDEGELTLAEVERRHIVAVLRREQGGIAAAARTLGISRSTLYEKMRRYEVEPPKSRAIG